MIRRPRHLARIKRVLSHNPVCALLGPRQCGKTTLAREVIRGRADAHVFDLETAAGRARLAEPELSLSPLKGLVVIDEIQRQPRLFEVLRPLSDRRGASARFLILGSASPDLLRGASESLAGRVGFVDLGGFDLTEVGARKLRQLWLRGGFPRSFLAGSEALSLRWRQDFVRTFLERDVPQLGIRIPAETLRRFWMMLAHYHAQIWNGAEFARSLGVSEHAVRRHLDVLAGTYLVRQLPPWFESLSKRQYKAPKVYVRDSGLLHALLGIGSRGELETHPKLGASWEGFALEQVLALTHGAHAYFWGTHAGAELDLLLIHRSRRYGVEFKYGDAPVMTRSLHVALTDLKLDRAWIVYPGTENYAVHDKVEVAPLVEMPDRLAFMDRPAKTRMLSWRGDAGTGRR
ncbi:MAG: ATP-binding protein [Burkholderiales bacterium]